MMLRTGAIWMGDVPHAAGKPDDFGLWLANIARAALVVACATGGNCSSFKCVAVAVQDASPVKLCIVDTEGHATAWGNHFLYLDCEECGLRRHLTGFNEKYGYRYEYAWTATDVLVITADTFEWNLREAAPPEVPGTERIRTDHHDVEVRYVNMDK